MPEFGTMVAGLSLALTLSDRAARREEQEQVTGGDNSIDADTLQEQKNTSEKLDRLIAIEGKNQPTPGDKDAYASATIELSAGETATVTVQPQDGFNLRVQRVYFDRRDGHDYKFNIGGDVTSVAHRAKYTSPKPVTQSDRVVAEVTNNSGSSSVVDFEMDAWAEEP